MIYGGLTSSRLHHAGRDELDKLLFNFNRVKEINPDIKLYVFSTVMRTPRTGGSTAEPGYYQIFGSRIFKITALRDKEAVVGLSLSEKEELERLLKGVPVLVLNDWLQRRDENFHVNTRLVEKNRTGIIDYLILCRDDTAVYSQSSKEWRALYKKAGDLPASKFISFSGADEVGLVLLTRAVNHWSGKIPAVYARFAPGVGKNTVPAYEDQAVWKNVRNHIYAARCRPAFSPGEADLILAVNTPENGISGEAGAPGNTVQSSPAADLFADEIKKDIRDGRKVAVADVAFANGADNTLMAVLSDKRLLSEITAYAGWNTAGNSIGYALCQGVLASHIGEAGAARLLAVWLLDDWAYQANVRGEINREIIKNLDIDRNKLDSAKSEVQAETEKRLLVFAKNNLADFDIQEIKVTFPWSRTFDINVEVNLANQKTAAEIQ